MTIIIRPQEYEEYIIGRFVTFTNDSNS